MLKMLAPRPVLRELIYGVVLGVLWAAAPAEAVPFAPGIGARTPSIGPGLGGPQALQAARDDRFCRQHPDHRLCRQLAGSSAFCDRNPKNELCAAAESDRFCEERLDHPLCDPARFCNKRPDHPLCDDDPPSPS